MKYLLMNNKTQYKKDFHTVPSPEEIQINEPYAITINMAEKYEDLIQSLNAYNYLIYNKLNLTKYEYYFEYSKKFRLHIHGITIFETYSQILKFFQAINSSELHNKFAICIKQLDDPMEWLNYCTKQDKYMTEYMGEHEYRYYRHTHDLLRKDKNIRKTTHLRDILYEALELDE